MNKLLNAFTRSSRLLTLVSFYTDISYTDICYYWHLILISITSVSYSDYLLLASLMLASRVSIIFGITGISDIDINNTRYRVFAIGLLMREVL